MQVVRRSRSFYVSRCGPGNQAGEFLLSIRKLGPSIRSSDRIVLDYPSSACEVSTLNSDPASCNLSVSDDCVHLDRFSSSTKCMSSNPNSRKRTDKVGTVVAFREIGTGISEANKRIPIFPFATEGGKQASSYFRQRNWVQAREAQIRIPAGGLEFDNIEFSSSARQRASSTIFGYL